jgi:protein O-mannosyl-transferase
MNSPKELFERKFFRYPALFFIFVLLSFIAYSNILNSFFLADDFELIKGAKNFGPFAPWTPGAAQGFFRPLVTLSIFLDYRLWGLNPTGYHATNLLFHSLNGLLVLFISRALFARSKSSSIEPWSLATLSGIMFLVLPCHTESVTWISGRTDLLATLFCLASFRVYLMFLEKGKRSVLILSMLCFLVALSAKELVIIFPVIILGYDCFRDYESYSSRMTKRRLLRCLGPGVLFALVIVVYLTLKYMVSGSTTLGYGLRAHLNLNLLKVLKDYLVLLTRPFIPPIPVDYQTFIDLKSLITFKAASLIWLGLGIIALVLVTLFIPKFTQRLRRIQPRREMLGLLLFLLFAVIILFIPALSSGISIRDTNNERFVYLPSAYYAILLSLILLQWVGKRSCRVWIFWGLFLFFTFSLYRLNGNWQLAGELSRSAVQDLIKLEGQGGKLYLISLPGEMRGAHIHVSIQDALELFNTRKPPKLIVISWLYLVRPEDGIHVVKKLNVYQVKTSNPQGYFFSYRYPLDRGPVIDRFFDLVPSKPNYYYVRLKEIEQGDRVISLSQGKLIALERY